MYVWAISKIWRIFPKKSKITWIYTTKIIQNFPIFVWEKSDKILLEKRSVILTDSQAERKRKKNISQAWNDEVTLDSVILDGWMDVFLVFCWVSVP
jgi:hypothetical protein